MACLTPYLQGVITFGDPFNGANIAGYNGSIAIFCRQGDGVCTGNFEVAASHMAYSGDVKAAQKKLLEMAKGTFDDKCCKPRPQVELPSPEGWKKVLDCNGGKVPKGKQGTSVDKWEQTIVEMVQKGTCKARRMLYNYLAR
jgi:cutinase